jgi:CCR4-NOT transcription complex subunit 7/8
MYAQDSIDLLKNSGIDFHKFERDGINVHDFGELLITSGLVLNDDIKWYDRLLSRPPALSRLSHTAPHRISFHSGYDFGYLLKLLTCNALPAEETDFFNMMKLYFPAIYDIKYLMKSCRNLRGGLNDLAEDLAVARYGPQHQAGSDSLLTAATFFKLRELFFEDSVDDDKYLGVLYGLQ